MDVPAGRRESSFLTTRWTWVAAAGGADSERAREALAGLCQAYWYPLYAYVRRFGVGAAEAEDVVQGFFARLIETRDLSKVTREGGSFRSFLRVAIRNHLANERDRERAAKRGGGRVRLAIDAPEAERRLAVEPAQEKTAEAAFDRAWALELMAACLSGLRAEYEESGRGAVFAALCAHLQAGATPEPIAAIAERLALSEVAVRVALHRLRERFRRRLEAEVASTLHDAGEVGSELAELLRALRS
jgi:RNA polymerase sigma-70 factor (ECF subfamily)